MIFLAKVLTIYGNISNCDDYMCICLLLCISFLSHVYHKHNICSLSSSAPPLMQCVWLGSCDTRTGAARLLPYGHIWTQTWTIWQDHRRVHYHSPDPCSADM